MYGIAGSGVLYRAYESALPRAMLMGMTAWACSVVKGKAMSRKRALLVCTCCYAAVCILTVLVSLWSYGNSIGFGALLALSFLIPPTTLFVFLMGVFCPGGNPVGNPGTHYLEIRGHITGFPVSWADRPFAVSIRGRQALRGGRESSRRQEVGPSDHASVTLQPPSLGARC